MHEHHLAGADLGATFDGYEDNFTWGTLNIDGQTVYLYDGNTTAGGALYVGVLTGAARVSCPCLDGLEARPTVLDLRGWGREF